MDCSWKECLSVLDAGAFAAVLAAVVLAAAGAVVVVVVAAMGVVAGEATAAEARPPVMPVLYPGSLLPGRGPAEGVLHGGSPPSVVCGLP